MRAITTYLKKQEAFIARRPNWRAEPGRKICPPTFNHYVDLRPLLRLWDMLCQMYALSLERDDKYADDLRKWRRRASRALEVGKIHNLKARLKTEMLRNPLRRQQVMKDLGGDKALDAWERRMAHVARRSCAPQSLKVYTQPNLEALRAGIVEPARRPGQVPTDITGYFRLAPIPRPLNNKWIVAVTEREREDRAEAQRLRAELRFKIWDKLPPAEKYGQPYIVTKEYYAENGVAKPIYEIKPIPVTPEELRGVVSARNLETVVIPILHRRGGAVLRQVSDWRKVYRDECCDTPKRHPT